MGCRVRLPAINTRRLLRLKNELVCCIKLVADMVGCGIREFVNDTNAPSFLVRDLMELSVEGYMYMVIKHGLSH